MLLSTESQNLELNSTHVREIARCIDDPWCFITHHIYTLEREQGVQRFPDWYYLKSLIEALHAHRMVIVLKSRQMLVSWGVSAFLLWGSIFRAGTDNLIISKRSDEAEEMLFRIRFMFRRLPRFLQISIGANNKNVLEFKERQSRIISLPATPDVGRSYAPNLIFWDEMAFTPYDEEIFASLQPSLDGGGKFIGVSSANGPWTKHGRLWLEAEEHGFTRVRIHYSQHPSKNEVWEKEARKGISQMQWDREQEMSLDVGGLRVYDRFSDSLHIIEWKFNPHFHVYRAIDFGYRTPVVLWIQVTPEDTVIICREWIGENHTISDMIEYVRAGDHALGITEQMVASTYCDPAGAAKNDSGISPVEYLIRNGTKIQYRTSSVMAGIDLVREKLLDASGRVGLKVARECPRVINDFKRYQKHKETDEPIKDNIADHTMDAVRYFMVNYFQMDADNLRAGLGARVVGISRR